MRCIKMKCKYCSKHEYHTSYLQCDLEMWSGGFSQAATNKKCCIDKYIQEKMKGIEELEQYRQKILTQQN